MKITAGKGRHKYIVSLKHAGHVVASGSFIYQN
jgi:hypothetical protein